MHASPLNLFRSRLTYRKQNNMELIAIDNIAINDYPIYEAMKSNSYVRFSKQNCAIYFEKLGRKNLTDTRRAYDSLLPRIIKELKAEQF
jgi:hypothetical protein